MYCLQLTERRKQRERQSTKSGEELQRKKLVKKIKGKNGRPDRVELLFNKDFVVQTLGVREEVVEDYKELFLLQDQDQDGLLTLLQTITAVIMLGVRIGGYTRGVLCVIVSNFVNVEDDILLEILDHVGVAIEDQDRITVTFDQFLLTVSQLNDFEKERMDSEKMMEYIKSEEDINFKF